MKLLGARRKDKDLGGSGTTKSAETMSASKNAPGGGNKATADTIAAATKPLDPMAVTAEEMKQHLGRSYSGNLPGGQSTYATIHKALQAYEKTATSSRVDEKTAKALLQLNGLCTRWINEHGRSTDPRDAARGRLIRTLADDMPRQQMEVSKRQALKVYLDALVGEGPSPLQAATQGARSTGKAASTPMTQADVENAKGLGGDVAAKRQARVDLIASTGITPAEQSAIGVYSTEDYNYINPATANSEPFLEDRRTKTAKYDLANPFRALDNKTVMDEGRLHAGVAMSGLKKLPAHQGLAYRGETRDVGRFAQVDAVGKETELTTFTSTSTKPEVAANFLKQNLDPAGHNTIGILWVFSNAGGRDIQALSNVSTEGEILLLAGSKFKLMSVDQITAGGTATGAFPEHSAMIKLARELVTALNDPRLKIYVIHAEPPPLPKAAGAGAGQTPQTPQTPQTMPPLPALPKPPGSG